MTDRLRIERDRVGAERLADSLGHRTWSPSGRTYVGTVYDGGSMPSSNRAWYLTNPTMITGPETEGASWTPTVDTGNTVPVLVIGNAPGVGDILLADNIGGIWVSDGGVKPFAQTITVNGCANNGNPAYPGATVSIYPPGVSSGAPLATGTTNSLGQIYLTWPGSPGNFQVVVTEPSGRFSTYNALAVMTGSSTTITLSPAPGYHCFALCLLPLKDNLNFSFLNVRNGDTSTDTLIYTATGTGSYGAGWYGAPNDSTFMLAYLGGGYFYNGGGSAFAPASLSCPPSLDIVYNFYTGTTLIWEVTITE